MELLLILFCIYALACICLGLLWFLYKQYDEAKEERLSLQTFIQNLTTSAEIERRDLYDRIQAGTLPQYKDYKDEPNDVSTYIEDDDGTVPIDDDIKEEIMNG